MIINLYNHKLELIISKLLKVYMIINFRSRRINQDMHKLIRLPILKKKSFNALLELLRKPVPMTSKLYLTTFMMQVITRVRSSLIVHEATLLHHVFTCVPGSYNSGTRIHIFF